MGALINLARNVGVGLTRSGGPLSRIAPALGLGIGGFSLGSALDNGEVVKRRRRRKALTNDDVRTALTIASAISKKAAENFILMRVRGQ